MQFSRHAKNELRLYNLIRADAELIVSSPVQVERESRGNWRYLGQVEGNWIVVVVAGDNPDVIITVHPRRHR